MTRLRIAILFVAVVAGDYAALMLLDCQLVNFGVAAALCAGASLAAAVIGLIDQGDVRRRQWGPGDTERRLSGHERRSGSAKTSGQLPVPTNSALHANVRTRSQVKQPDSITDECSRIRGAHTGSWPGADPATLRCTSGASSDERASRTGAHGDDGCSAFGDRFGPRRAVDGPCRKY